MKMIIANFKSNKNREEYSHWMDEFEKHSTQISKNQLVILAPSMPDLMFMSNRLLSKELHPRGALAVQDISPYPAGSYTGAISAYNLVGFNVKYAIVGHSERRKYFHETSSDVAKKIRECIAANITPIVCVSKDEINAQANMLEANERAKCIVAFEPIEHIGTGESDTLEDIFETKQWVRTAFGTIPYIYGGSVNSHTDPAILTSPEIDGFLVGSASLEPQTFLSLIENVQ